MYLAIDVGATKTLLAVFDSDGTIAAQEKLATPKTTDLFFQNLKPTIDNWQKQFELSAGAVALPGTIDREQNQISYMPNLNGWELDGFGQQLGRLTGMALRLENDANAGGLAEAVLGAGKEFQRVLYLTISTGVGTGFIVNGAIDPYFADLEGGHLLFKGNPKAMTVEFCISGPAIKRRFSKQAYEITSSSTWHRYARDVAVAISNYNHIYRPEAVILGGGVSVHTPKFIEPLKKYLEELKWPVLALPAIKQAKFVETAVIHGCYLLAKETTPS